MRYLFLLLAATPLYANEPSFSLFLTEEEQSKYREKNLTTSLPWPSNKLTLKAIMMMDPHNWTIWINEHKITPETCPDHLEIQNVAAEGVDLVWSTEQGPQPLHLKVNETIDLKDLEEPDEPAAGFKEKKSPQ